MKSSSTSICDPGTYLITQFVRNSKITDEGLTHLFDFNLCLMRQTGLKFGLRSCLRFLKMLLIESPNSGSAETLLPKCGHSEVRLLPKIRVNLLHIERDTALVGGP